MTTVVVVEDEILVRIAICEDLAAEGYEVLTADNADQAIEILENDITTIFTDIEMPGSMNGLKLAAAVRDRWPPVNIVITTGKVRPPDDQMPTNSRFVAKPYQKAKVLEALQTFEGQTRLATLGGPASQSLREWRELAAPHGAS